MRRVDATKFRLGISCNWKLKSKLKNYSVTQFGLLVLKKKVSVTRFCFKLRFLYKLALYDLFYIQYIVRSNKKRYLRNRNVFIFLLAAKTFRAFGSVLVLNRTLTHFLHVFFSSGFGYVTKRSRLRFVFDALGFYSSMDNFSFGKNSEQLQSFFFFSLRSVRLYFFLRFLYFSWFFNKNSFFELFDFYFFFDTIRFNIEFSVFDCRKLLYAFFNKGSFVPHEYLFKYTKKKALVRFAMNNIVFFLEARRSTIFFNLFINWAQRRYLSVGDGVSIPRYLGYKVRRNIRLALIEENPLVEPKFFMSRRKRLYFRRGLVIFANIYRATSFVKRIINLYKVLSVFCQAFNIVSKQYFYKVKYFIQNTYSLSDLLLPEFRVKGMLKQAVFLGRPIFIRYFRFVFYFFSIAFLFKSSFLLCMGFCKEIRHTKYHYRCVLILTSMVWRLLLSSLSIFGIFLKVNGRFNKSRRTRCWSSCLWVTTVSLSNPVVSIDFSQMSSLNKKGLFGVAIWLI